LVHAAHAARAAGETVNEAAIARHLYLPDLPPVDVLVRTSGELRISNFMLWQIAGAQVYFTERTWPEFDATELDAALALAGS
jgi:undecaprenyl diphosphate synthase